LSIVDQIRALEELAKLDSELKSVGDALVVERALLEGLKTSLAAVEAKVTAERAALESTEKARGEAYAEARSTAGQLDASRDKMNRARTERETNAVQRELEELRKLQRDREEEVERFGKSIEAIRGALTAAEEEKARILAELAEKEGLIAANVGELEAAHGTKAGGRDALVRQLPTIMYRRYDAVRAKRGSGLAKTTSGTCTACNIALPPQLFHRLRREPMIEQCPSCNRLIYFAPPVAPSVSS
jgi:predicted  nucleic acid-binding Zn-ribbon protein